MSSARSLERLEQRRAQVAAMAASGAR
jgi:hypothetical protein